jgi:type IV secretion system protein VirB9
MGAVGLLAACAAKEPPPRIDYDEIDFRPASVEPEPPRPIEVVAIPRPLPLPGQLKPVPGGSNHAPKEDASDPHDRVHAAQDAARFEPAADGYVNAVQVYPFTEGALYRLYAAPSQVSDVALQPGEQLASVSAGNTVRWVVGDTTSGKGAEARVHILVKPIAPGLVTNLVIMTDRRAYHLELESTEATYMAAVSWTYPHDELIALRSRGERAKAAEQRTVAEGLVLASLRFRYKITGDDPPWRPTRVFDDRRKVYIQFPSGLIQGEAPPLFVVGQDGDAELVNYRVRGNYYIVDRLFAAAELRLGEEPQQVVRITRTDGRERGS